MNPTLLRKVYKIFRAKKKKYRWYKVDKKSTPEAVRKDLSRMKRQLTMAKNDGYRLVYLDETMFTRKTVPETEWTLPKQNVVVDATKLNEPTLALLASISKEKDLEHFQIFEKSVDIPKFKGWLRELRRQNADDKICLFMDKLSCHTSKKAKATMRELGFRWIYNVSYSP